MDPALKFYVLLVLVGLVNASFAETNFGHCERIVRSWASSSLDKENRQDKHTLRDLLFFLHVPRTGGRTYFHCFLRKLYPNSLECPRSYDKLRFDPRKPKCRLLATHDDYSLTSEFPKERTSVVTILRNPVDRVFSTYEFSIEVAARFLAHPNLTSAMDMMKRLRGKAKGASTLDIWPWKYLVPWMREDLFARRDARYGRGQQITESNDSYDMEDFAMPLHEYINHPVAEDIVHNGATFQVAGLTNNSYQPESHEVRHCVQKHNSLGKYVLGVAKKRLDDMLYIGLTEEHRESATVFANVVGAQVISQIKAPNSSLNNFDNIEQSSFSDSEPDKSENQSSTSDKGPNETDSSKNRELTKSYMTVEKLTKAYESCIHNLRKLQATRRISSLKKISPVNFSKEARLQIPEVVLQRIQYLNDLDLELYEYAKDLFSKQNKTMQRLNEGAQSFESPIRWGQKNQTVFYSGVLVLSLFGITSMVAFISERWDKIASRVYGLTLWTILPIAIPLAFLLFLCLVIVNVRRRTLNLKVKL